MLQTIFIWVQLESSMLLGYELSFLIDVHTHIQNAEAIVCIKLNGWGNLKRWLKLLI